LGVAVPGFTDTIVMTVVGREGISLMRWWPTRAAPQTIASLEEEGYFVGLDASGGWIAGRDQVGTLSVRPITDAVGDPPAWGWLPSTPREAVGIRVASAAWHDTEPGRLAWVSCPRTPDEMGTLYTLDVTEVLAEVPVGEVDDPCGEGSGMWLQGWGDWGFELIRWDEGLHPPGAAAPEPARWGERVVLLDADATEKATLAYDVGFHRGPDGVIWTEDAPGPRATSYLVIGDDQTRRPVPGLGHDEWTDGALWSPDGSTVALSPRNAVTDTPMIRIVDMATNTIVGEVSDPDACWPLAWSTDGRFLFYMGVGEGQEADPPVAWLVFDTVTGNTTDLSVPKGQYLDQIRTAATVPAAEQIAPVTWGIAPNTNGPGTHLVSMIVEVRPLTPDQIDNLSGKLIWGDTVVDLCSIDVREVGTGYLRIGDIFGTNEGCGNNPAAMHDAFEEHGTPETACITITTIDENHEYCAPLR
jgi:hypothetical protein